MLRQDPYGTRLLIKQHETQAITSSGGALLTQADIPTGNVGTIIARGPSCIHPKAQVGMEVIYPVNNVAKEIHLDGVKYYTLMEHECYFFQTPLDSKSSEDRML